MHIRALSFGVISYVHHRKYPVFIVSRGRELPLELPFLTQKKTNDILEAAASPVITLGALMFRLGTWLSNAYNYAWKKFILFFPFEKCCYYNFPTCVCTSKLVDATLLTSVKCKAHASCQLPDNNKTCNSYISMLWPKCGPKCPVGIQI